MDVDVRSSDITCIQKTKTCIYIYYTYYIYVFIYRSIYVWSRGACVYALHIYIYQSIIDITMQREKHIYTDIRMYHIHRYIDASTKYMYMYTHTVIQANIHPKLPVHYVL